VRPSLKIDAAEAGLSRTMARTLLPEHPSVREIEALYRSAIASADSHIYMENQYFGSRSVFDALVQRLKAAGRPKIKLIMVYPRELVSITESMSMGASQNGMFAALKDLAAREGHDFGLYYSRSKVPGEEEKPRYIHSKLLLVDDRFLTVGSANTNNRSMGLDSELNISWEAPSDGDPALERSLRRVRLSLLAEHAGLSPRVALRRLGDVETLVETLDVLANDPDGALRRRPVPASADERDWPALDPTGPVEEDVFEPVAPRRRALLRRGFRRLRRVLGRRRRGFAVNPPGALATAPGPWRLTLSQAAWRASFLTLLLALALGVAWAVTATAGFLLGR
jgi:phospholipase D1/2